MVDECSPIEAGQSTKTLRARPRHEIEGLIAAGRLRTSSCQLKVDRRGVSFVFDTGPSTPPTDITTARLTSWPRLVGLIEHMLLKRWCTKRHISDFIVLAGAVYPDLEGRHL